MTRRQGASLTYIGIPTKCAQAMNVLSASASASAIGNHAHRALIRVQRGVRTACEDASYTLHRRAPLLKSSRTAAWVGRQEMSMGLDRKLPRSVALPSA